MRLIRLVTCAVLALTVTATGCGPSLVGPPSCEDGCINVGLQNSSNGTMTISIAGGAEGTVTVSVPPGYSSTEIHGKAGNALVFTATQNTAMGSVTCTATSEIVDTSTYGQVNFIPGGNSILAECATSWLESL